MSFFNKNKKSRFGSDKRETKENNQRNFRDLGRHEMTNVTCDACGVSCQVPFKPNGRKAIYCNDCFYKNSSNSSDYQGARSKTFSGSNHQQFKQGNHNSNITLELINEKLDRILDRLN